MTKNSGVKIVVLMTRPDGLWSGNTRRGCAYRVTILKDT
jgi:hypothetical protein